MGLRNPFRFDVDRARARCTSATTRRTRGARTRSAGPRARAAGSHQRGRATTAGRSATAEPALHRLRLRDPHVRRGVQLRRAGQRLAAQHRPAARCRRSGSPEFWYTYGAVGAVPGARHTGGIGPMGGPVYNYDEGNQSRTKWPEYYDNVPLFGEFTRDKRHGMRTDGRGNLPASSSSCRRSRSTTRWTWSSARTARSTCSSTATASSPRTRTRSWPRIDYVRGNRTPVAEGRRRPERRARRRR